MSSGLPIKRLLLFTLGPLVAVVVLLLAMGIAAITVAAGSVEELVTRVQPMQRANADLRSAVLDGARGMRGYAYTGQREFREAYERGRRAHPGLGEELARLATPDELTTVRRLDELTKQWFAAGDAVMSTPAPILAPERLLDGNAVVLEDFLELNTRLAATLDATSGALKENNARVRMRAQLTLAIWGTFAIAFAAIAAITIGRRLVGSITGVRNTVTRLSTGELSARVAEEGPAEVHQLARSINTLASEAERLHDVEEERDRYRAVARDIGVRIREHLDADDVVRVAVAEVGRRFDAARVCVWLTEGVLEDTHAVLAVSEWHQAGLSALRTALTELDRLLPVGSLRALYADRRSQQVLTAEDAGELGLPHVVRDRAVLVIPFGSGDFLLGAVAVVRDRARPLLPEEIDALEQITGDLARGVDQARLYQEQQRLVRELRALDRNKSEFVSNVSHELRTPMTSIAGYVEMLRDGDGGAMNEYQRKMLEIVHRNTTRLRGLIEELLLLAKLESGAVIMAEETVDVGSLVDGVVDTLRPAADVGGVQLDGGNSDGGELMVVIGDPGHLDRVLTNLVSNAVKFTPAGGEVHVTSRRCDGWIEVRVTDTGIGIPKAEQQEMFTRFYRASNATQKAIPGSGLGLAIVQQIVHRHGGQVALTSEEGAGTTATVRLPAARRGD